MKVTRVFRFFLFVLFFLLVWEFAYRLGLISAVRVSHPLGIYEVLSYPAFLRGFGILLLQVAFASLLGGAIGVAIAAIIRMSDSLTWSAIRFLRLGQWLPFLVLWGHPLGLPPKSSNLDINFWSSLIAWTSVLIVPMVVLAACYHRLSFAMLIQAEQNLVPFKLFRAVVFHALLLCLLFQLFFIDEGWPWYWFLVIRTAAVGWAAMILLAVLIFIMCLKFCSTFDRTVNLRRAVLMNELQNSNLRSFLGASLIASVCAVLWLLFDEAWKKVLLIPPLQDVLAAAYRLLIAGTTVIHESKPTVWWDVGFSLLEIFGGILVAGLVAFAISKILLRENAAKRSPASFLPLTYVAPVAFWPVLFFWLGVGIWPKVGLVACLVFFPFVQALGSFKDAFFLKRVLVAADEALPLAFVAMAFGESYGATEGLVFVKFVASARLAFPESIAAALITFAFLAVISATLRWIIKRLYFSNGADQMTVAEVT